MMLFRYAENSDAAQLKKLWKLSFGDTDELINKFLGHFGFGSAVVGEEAGLIKCAAYILPTDGIITAEGAPKSCSYIYAVAVLPEFRGNGLGREITLSALRFSKKRGYDYAVLKPSDGGLYRFYGSLGFSVFTYANELKFKFSGLPAANREHKILPVSVRDYMRIRETLLSGRSYVAPSRRGVSYQASLGALFGLQLGDETGCAAAETNGREVFIKELLISPNLIPDAVSLVATKLPSAVYNVSTPVFDERYAVKTGMIYPQPDPVSDKPFLCFAYD